MAQTAAARVVVAMGARVAVGGEMEVTVGMAVTAESMGAGMEEARVAVEMAAAAKATRSR